MVVNTSEVLALVVHWLTRNFDEESSIKSIGELDLRSAGTTQFLDLTVTSSNLGIATFLKSVSYNDLNLHNPSI